MQATPLNELLTALFQGIEPAWYRLGTAFVLSILDDPAMFQRITEK